MKKGGGAQKGSAFEREICKKLSLWWTDGERDDVFWRTAGSGGRGTNRAKKGKTTAGAHGDLTFTDPIGKPLLDVCCFEIKRGYKPDALDLVDKARGGKQPVLMDFYEQATLSAKNAIGKYGVVIFKRDQKLAVIMFCQSMFRSIAMYNGVPNVPMLIFDQWYTKDKLVFMTFYDFLDWATPHAIKEMGGKF